MELVEEIITMIEEQTNVSFVDMRSRNRKANIREARQLAIHFIHKYSGFSLSKSARILNRHHATAIHGNKVVENELTTSKPYQRKYKFINALITNRIKNG
jgi:chromosomal replication initiation ATPase DnaA